MRVPALYASLDTRSILRICTFLVAFLDTEVIAEKLNVQEKTNYFTGDECYKKFLSLTKAFYTAKRIKEETEDKRSIIGEELYEEFSTNSV
ncbi:hypothetical protein GLOIN_2v1571918 [Rhizophagus irregularis DAOM 181602=DAOM 197198]|nr:hypothetical protein GLOIN_2v1571918 [Rhizophagus irregularis DAOM 181602=DAOM 197198]